MFLLYLVTIITENYDIVIPDHIFDELLSSKIVD